MLQDAAVINVTKDKYFIIVSFYIVNVKVEKAVLLHAQVVLFNKVPGYLKYPYSA